MTDPLRGLPPVPAWLVVDGKTGGRAVFLDHSRAKEYAATQHAHLFGLCVMGGPWCNRPAPDGLSDG